MTSRDGPLKDKTNLRADFEKITGVPFSPQKAL